MENSEQQKTYIGSVRQHLESELRTYLGGKVKDDARILSVGCGFAYESKPLLDIFPNAVFIGIDIDEKSLLGARVSNPEIPKEAFRLGDAAKPETFGSTPWDVILLRNPQILGSMGAYLDKGRLPEEICGEWQSIFANSISTLKADGGVLFIALGSNEERDLAVKYLNENKKMKIIVNQENEHKIAKATFPDIFIIVAKRIE